jgi:hypothetical protein
VTDERVWIDFATTATVLDALERLRLTGFYGSTLGEVVERLVCERIRQVEAHEERLRHAREAAARRGKP